MTYQASNWWGTGVIDETDARRVWEEWAPERRAGDLEHGFTVWGVLADGSGILMGTVVALLPDEDEVGTTG